MYHVHKPKDEALAKEYREKGSQFYQQSKFYHALEFYNKSLCYALTGSEDIALAYGNRSAVYFQIKEFDKCLQNIKLARDAGFPKNKLCKLNDREDRCNELKPQHGSSDKDDDFFKLSYPSHVNNLNIAECLELRENEKFGRHIIANQDLKPGDIIAIEESPFKTLLADGSFTRCANCLSSNKLSLIPFETCASAMFCSEECREAGNKKYVCAFDEDSIVPRIALEAIEMVEGDLKKLDELMTNPELRSKTIFDLDLTDLNDPDFKYKQLLAFNSLAEYPVEVHSEFSNNHPILKRWSSKRNRNVIARFMGHVNRRINNGLICSFEQFWSKDKDGSINVLSDDLVKFIRFGSCIFLLHCFFNHSCTPNTGHIHVDNKLVFHVIYPIKKGEQLFISYGPFIDKAIEERQKFCWDDFNFVCSCDACVNNWKVEDLPFVDQRFKFTELKFTSIKAAKEEYKRNCKYINKNFRNFPCLEILLLVGKNEKLLSIIAKNEKFLLEKLAN